MERYEFTTDQRKLLEGLSQPLGIYQFLDKRVVTVLLSNGFCDVFGYKSLEEAYFDMDNNMYKYAHPDDVARIAEAAFRFATEEAPYEVIYRTRTKYSDEYRIIHATGKHVYTDEGARLAHIWYVNEGAYAGEGGSQRSELNRAFNSALHEESLVRESNYDYLTGLPNMTYFFDLAEEGRKLIHEKGGMPVLLYMDLSGMKFFNAQNGYAEGDNLLREFAMVLKNMFSDRNCCRIGVDHFAVYTEEAGLEDTLAEFFQICKGINGGNNLPVRVGIYSNRMGDASVSSACDRAKFACDSLGNTYESCYGYYDSSMLDDAERRRYVLSNIDRAIDEKWLRVYYQPIIRAVNGNVCNEEALSRWFDPDLGLLSPNDFIPALEGAGTICKLDLYVLEQVLEKMRSESEFGLEIVPHSINLSRSDFDSCDIVEEVVKRVDRSGIDRAKVVIEVTESTVGNNLEFMKEQLGRFRNLGFPVWMDDFGSGYSSIDLLQSIEFDLIKFDMSFMQRLDEGDGGKIVLTELVKMATALGIETLCEGVETEGQVRFLQEIGCAKLQGYYFCKPIPYEEILERYEKGVQIGFENSEESAYYDAIGRVNLYDLAVISNEDNDVLLNYFSTLPMGVIEVDGENLELVRTNQSYQDFLQRFFGVIFDEYTVDLPPAPPGSTSSFMQSVRQCCDKEGREFFDETMSDGSVVHSFARFIGKNPVTGKSAIAVAVLSVSEPNEGATYASIARALAGDYYNIYYVDLGTEKFIEYSSQVGRDELAMERHGEGFFDSARRDTMTRIYERDREQFLARFTKENVIRELDEQGVFTATYRLLDSGEPVYVNMKISRLHADANQIIVGISSVDSQMRQKELFSRVEHERDVLKSVAVLSGNYMSVYSVDVETGGFVEYNATSDYESLGIAKQGENFFQQARENGKRVVCPDDLPKYLEQLTEENVMREIQENGAFNMQYRLLINGEQRPVSLRIAKVEESDGERLVAGVRAWQIRKPAKDVEDSKGAGAGAGASTVAGA